LEIKEQKLKMSAMVDEMTGTYNRKAGLFEFESILACANDTLVKAVSSLST
jgi:GGDEF domain-containing protein